MSNVYVTADLHLGHEWLAKEIRNFNTVEEHDDEIVGSFQKVLKKRDVLWILGDVCWTKSSLATFLGICDMVERVHVVLGNHDQLLHPKLDDLSAGHMDLPLTIHGPGKQFSQFMFSHYPIPASSVLPGKLNVHGHVHRGGFDENSYNNGPWLNVNCEFWDYKPVSLETLRLERVSRGLEKEDPRYLPA